MGGEHRRPGRPGQSGRKPDRFYEICAAGVEAGLPKLLACITDPAISTSNPEFRWSMEFFANHVYPKLAPAGATLDLAVHDEDGTDAVELLLERLNAMDANIRAGADRVPPPVPYPASHPSSDTGSPLLADRWATNCAESFNQRSRVSR